MKVFYVTMQFPAPSETFASNDVLSLRRQGVDVSVHALRRAHPDADRMIEERGLTVVPLTHNSFWSLLRGVSLGVTQPQKLAKLILWNLKYNRGDRLHLVKSFLLFPRVFEIFDDICRIQPEVVHLFWGHYPSMVAFLVQTYLPNTKTTTFLGAYDLAMNYGGGEEVARRTDVVWTHVKENVTKIVNVGVCPERVNVVYRGMKLVETSPSTKKTARRITSVGRLDPVKSMDEVLTVFSHILLKWSDATLYILGDGPERGRLEGLAKSLGVEQAVTFLGHVSHDRVLEELAASEVFLLMSKKDWLPNVLKEAMASGCVCVATATTGMAELMPDKEAGFIIPIGDVQEATKLITDVFSGEFDTASIVLSARQHIRRYFDLDTSMGEYKETWESLFE